MKEGIAPMYPQPFSWKLYLRNLLKKALPHIAAIAIMYLLTVVYFAPVMFKGMDLPQSDNISALGMWKDAADYRNATGEYSEWTNGMFCGMPTTTVSGKPAFNIFGVIGSRLHPGLPGTHVGILFLFLLGFYIFLIAMGSGCWLALLGAVAYAFASYNLIILGVGHTTKGYVMAYTAPLIGGVILAYGKKYMAGFFITMLFLGFMGNLHPQISYYAAITVACIVVSYLIYYILQKEFPVFLKASAILLAAVILALAPNIGSLYPTYQYSKDTMRGGSELTITPNHKQSSDTPNAGGLEIDYAYQWSYGKMETFTHLVPNLYGGGHVMLDKNKDASTIQQLRNVGYGSAYLPTYWGNQPFTAGPVYAGAIVCFLFILGLFVVKGPEKWWMLAACIISFILSWGHNFMAVNEWLFHHLPLYNKFRNPSMSLVIAGWVMPMLGILALRDIIKGKIEKAEAWKYTRISFYITAGLCLFLALLGKTAFSFTGAGDAGYMQQLRDVGFPQNTVNDVMAILRDYRASMLYKDVFRSLVFISLAFGALWLYFKDKLKHAAVALPVLLSVFVLVDEWGVCKRYLNDANFQPKRQVANTVQPTEADRLIMQDKDINYRVLNLASNTFNESNTSYFHKSIGGYSPAKLRRYQDIIDFYMSRNFNFNVINMLNGRYIIMQNGQVYPNPDASGPAWFVDAYRLVENPDEEILSIDRLDFKDTAVVDKRWAAQLDGKDLGRDPEATLVNTQCLPNHLTYKSHAAKEQLAVFSEVFYDKGGWVAYIDGVETPHLRANYILRSMVIPAGDHTIDFKYIPHARLLGNRISAISSWCVIVLSCLLIGLNIYLKKRKQRQPVVSE